MEVEAARASLCWGFFQRSLPRHSGLTGSTAVLEAPGMGARASEAVSVVFGGLCAGGF